MTRPDRYYAPHLAITEFALPPGEEWRPQVTGWALLQVVAGTGYWMGPHLTFELKTGTVLVLSAQADGNLRASRLGTLHLQSFPVDPRRLTGVISLNEQRFFAAAAAREELSARIFPAHDPVAMKMKDACAGRDRGGSLSRLLLLQIFLEVFSAELKRELPAPVAPLDAKARLQKLLRKTPVSELLHMSLTELARMTRCTPRHLNRIFNEVVGMSFRDKHTELRLARACELLATTESKVVDVALESGYQSLSLFNLMFVRRFGISPGKWRRVCRANKPAGVSRRASPNALRFLSENPPQRAGIRRSESARVCV